MSSRLRLTIHSPQPGTVGSNNTKLPCNADKAMVSPPIVLILKSTAVSPLALLSGTAANPAGVGVAVGSGVGGIGVGDGVVVAVGSVVTVGGTAVADGSIRAA